MQSASSRIWTRVAVSISYDDNNYTTGTFYDKMMMNSVYHVFQCDINNFHIAICFQTSNNNNNNNNNNS